MDKISEHTDVIRTIIAEVLEIEPGEMTETSHFKEDHQADSLRAIEILARLEKEFKIVIPQEDLAKMTHLDAVCQVVRDRGTQN
ncbi:MAG: acyl carrier protein [Acidiferrobacterales bacterium]